MRFLLRVAFWLTVIVLLLPSDPNSEAPQVTFFQALDAVRGTITDLSQFCERNPELCATGEAVAQVVAEKALYGIEQLQAFLAADDAGENTLTPEDAGIPWQGTASAPVVAGY